MELRVLRYFIALAQAKTVSGAARALHLSQPTLSRQLTDLETEVGTPLFTRGARQITLTAQGRYLLSRATTIIALVDKTTQNLQTQQPILSGSLDIGAGESQGMARLMALIAGIQKDYPAVTVHLHSGDAPLVEDQLTNGRLDFGVIMGSRQLTNFHALKLPETNQWGVLLPKTAPLARQVSIAPTDLVGHPLLISEQAQTHHRFQDWWRNVATDLTINGTYNLLFNASLLVQNGSCYALGFDQLSDTSANSPLTFRPLTPPQVDPITIIWSRTQPLSPVAQLFLQRLQANLTTP
ncbi:LysR family transcriptional regulator [Levilactobacillus suantsaii]|uniref:LysR family transcriptional regulator n=1 Tax=Levilactobacillus suantsaii TaxID=2292255 RepID=A0A4Q0VL05_9LACO|nr:LysR family transcriptional regulator [Levilactobacillus suantsaii]QMU08810.1 LysR family transcriptional regulator [Levilactobacillus suantsaii]RXI78980.1 LysR family transcriptional regulator [Levilactobacillus suantsaii]